MSKTTTTEVVEEFDSNGNLTKKTTITKTIEDDGNNGMYPWTPVGDKPYSPNTSPYTPIVTWSTGCENCDVPL